MDVDRRQVAVVGAVHHVDDDGQTTHEGLALDERDDAFLEVLAGLDDRNVGEPEVGVQGTAVGAVHTAEIARADPEVGFLGGIGARVDHRAAVVVDGGPVQLFDVLGRRHERAGGAVQGVEVAVAVGLDDGLDRVLATLHVDQEDLRVAVVVPDVVGGELEVPLPLPGIGIHGQQAVGVEVVARAQVAVPVGGGVARRPVEHVRLRVVGAARPGGGAARLVGVACPGLGARLAFGRYVVVPPAQLARGDVVGVEEAAHAELPAGHADDGHVLDDHGHGGGAEAFRVVGDRLLPGDRAGQAVEGDQLGVEGGHQHEVARDGGTAVHLAAAQAQTVGLLVVVAPVDFTAGRVESEDPVVRRGDVHDAVVDRRRDLELLRGAGGKRPGHPELRRVLRGDVVDGRVAVVGVVATVVEPLLGVRRRSQQMLPGHRPVPATDVPVVGPVMDDRRGRRLHRRGIGRGRGRLRHLHGRLFATHKTADHECRGDRIAHELVL